MGASHLIADGKQHGIVIADHLIEGICYRRLTPAAAVDTVATNVQQHVNDMLAAGRSSKDTAIWVREVRRVFQQRMVAHVRSM
jgi:hypothetical protein